MSDRSDRTIRVEALTRVEGEGGLHLRLAGDAVDQVRLEIYEPPRLFESLLRGRAIHEAPDITARICGICPVAYQMSTVHAIERALGIGISPEIRRLRRLLYCGEWIESHVLHIHLLHLPDFFGYESGLAMAADYPQEITRGLRLKKHGNELLEVLGGRAIHPVNVTVGGFYRAPLREKLAALVDDFQWGLEAAIEMTRWLAGLEFPPLEREYEYVALVHPDEYAMNEGQIGSSRCPAIDVDRFEQHFEEVQVPHSTALHAVHLDTGRAYLVGPLARVTLSRERLAPRARRLADELNFPASCGNIFQSIVARGLEVVHAYEEALEILMHYDPPRPPRVRIEPGAGSGAAATEAPRGTLYHRYVLDDAGRIAETRIVPPTSQNQAQIEDDLRSYAPSLVGKGDEALARGCENLVRSYDPCISCATHFLHVTVERTSDDA